MYSSCTKEDNCLTCSVSVEYIDGGDCDQLANTDLSINSGCISVPMDNEYNVLVDIINNSHTRVNMLYADGQISTSLYNSLTYHYEIMSSLRGNSYNQMINPDVDELRSWFRKYFIGFNQRLNFDPSSLPDSLVVAAGIKTIYSYITIGCVMNSVANFSSIVIEGDYYGYATLNASDISCPTDLKLIGATFDQAIAKSLRTNGLGPVNLSLPFEYIQTPAPGEIPRIEIAPAEMLSLQNGEVAHCPTSVFTTTPATLNTIFYECCVEKTDLEKLGEANAFAGLILTFAVVTTTLVFWPWNPISEENDH